MNGPILGDIVMYICRKSAHVELPSSTGDLKFVGDQIIHAALVTNVRWFAGTCSVNLTIFPRVGHYILFAEDVPYKDDVVGIGKGTVKVAKPFWDWKPRYTEVVGSTDGTQT